MKPTVLRSAWLRLCLIAGFALALAFPQLRDALRPAHTTRVEIRIERADTGQPIPARVYLFKGADPFRLSPVDALLPLRADLFYRERIWRQTERPSVLEVTARDASHFILLDGQAAFDLPRSRTDIDEKYRVEVYHGMFFKPAVEEFTLGADETRRITVRIEPVAPGRQENWLSADDHIHLMRAREDDDIFLRWIAAEDLSVANFLELQRQQHAAVQYAFGREGEARNPRHSIRSGHESRSLFYGHVLVLGPERMVEPLSIGEVYANSPEAYPYPSVVFDQGRKLGGVTGFAHFYGSQPNSTLIMNLARNEIDFVELFQFGALHTAEWYELLNAGFRVVGNAGSDFPANIGRLETWPRIFPLLGPERALVLATPGESAYDAWADGIRRGAAVVTNGPFLEFSVDDQTPGAVLDWQGASKTVRGTATAVFHRPIEKLEIVVNGEVVASRPGDTQRTELTLPFETTVRESSWIAARAKASSREKEPEIWAHANPVYLLKNGEPVYREGARKSVRERWAKEAAFYRNPSLVFAEPAQRQRLLEMVAETETILTSPQPRWR